MKIQHCFPALVLAAALIRPLFAACIGDVLQPYLKNPKGPNSPGTVLADTQFALVEISTVHQDAKPHLPFMQATGIVDLRRIESEKSKNGTLPAHFSVFYKIRVPEDDCDTWDSFKPKTGQRLVAFFRPDGKGWMIPDLPAVGVVSDVSKMSPALRAKVQPLFRTRL